MNLPTVKEILDSARAVYLNDATASIYTDAKLLAHAKAAYGFLETELEKHNIACKNDVTKSILVPVGATLLNLPADFMWPIKMEERLQGSNDLFIPMVNRMWVPSIGITDKLIYWVWNLDQIQLLGANTNREVRLYYQKRFPSIQDVDNFVFGKADQYMSAKIAALAHLFLSQNETLANECNKLAEENLAEIVGIFVKKTQAMPVRRKPYIPFR
jgi:hypothetical protein